MIRVIRLSAILTYLKSKRLNRAQDLAAHFDVSLRTIYRDIKALQAAGVPIGSKTGSGYFIMEGYILPPVMFTETEANALIMAKKMLTYLREDSLIKDYEGALIKIRSVLKHRQKEKLELLEERIYQSINTVVLPSNLLSSVQLAIINNQILCIKYHSIYKDEITIRHIEPLAVYFTDQSWVAIAFCQLRNEFREFRFDRILHLQQLTSALRTRRAFSLSEYLQKKFQRA